MLVDLFEKRSEDRLKAIGTEIRSQEELLTARIKRRRSMSNKSTSSEHNRDFTDL